MYGSEKVDYVYDELGRLTTRTATNGAAYPTAYTYLPGGYGDNSTTALVSQITHGSGDNALTYAYTYDSRGNITTETRNGETTTYHYDNLGQLVRVDDPHENATWVYAYDLGGNILSKAKYALNDLTSTPETTSFTYDTTWKDKLIAVNGVEIGYDEIGNPLSDGEWNYEWQAGRQLAQIANKDVTVEFTYDHNGLRTQKKVTKDGVTTTTDYTLHGKLITHLTQGSNSLHFYYDANSRPAMVNFNGEKYTYVHNLQGDIVAILDNSGNIVVEYKYDAWGKLIATTGSKSATLGKINPFRYRGYVYDEETGLYYLKKRYFSSLLTRFLSFDVLLDPGTGLLGHALYLYCKNNPVNNYDPSGNDFVSWLHYKCDVVEYEISTVWSCLDFELGLGLGIGGDIPGLVTIEGYIGANLISLSKKDNRLVLGPQIFAYGTVSCGNWSIDGSFTDVYNWLDPYTDVKSDTFLGVSCTKTFDSKNGSIFKDRGGVGSSVDKDDLIVGYSWRSGKGISYNVSFEFNVGEYSRKKKEGDGKPIRTAAATIAPRLIVSSGGGGGGINTWVRTTR